MNPDAGVRMAHDAGERTVLGAVESTALDARERTALDVGNSAIPDTDPLSSRMRRSGRFDAYMSRGPDLPSMTAIVAASAAGREVSR